MRKTDQDMNNTKKYGDRIDNRNLIEEWLDKMEKGGQKHKFLWNISDFETLNSENYDHILGN